MGDFALIDSYLGDLRKAVSWRPDSDDVIAELADHLQVAVEREVALGVDPVEAQRNSISRFGETRLVSRALASTYAGGVAVPTQRTRIYGLMGMVGAVSMLAFSTIMLIYTVPMLERNGLTGTDTTWPVFAISFLGFAGIPLLILGLKERHGGTMGRWAWLAIGLAGASAIVMVAPWMLPVGAVLAGLGTLVAGFHVLGEGRSPRVPTLLFSSGLLMSVAAWVIASQFGGVRDYWGDLVMPRVVASATIVALFVPGYFLVGRWLHSETAVNEPEAPVVTS